MATVRQADGRGVSPGLLDVREVAALLHVTTDTIYRLLRDGRLPGLRVGGQWRFRRDEVGGCRDRTAR